MSKQSSTIKEVQGGNVFCGPAVISGITGASTDKVAELINRYRGRPWYAEVKGAYSHELISVLDTLGYDSVKYGNPYINSSLFFCLTILKKNGFYIATLPNHFVLIEKTDSDRFFCDNRTKTPMRAEGSARLSQRVIELIYAEKREKRVESIVDDSPALPLPPKVEQPKPIGPSKLEIAQRLLKQYAENHSINFTCNCSTCVEARLFLGEMK